MGIFWHDLKQLLRNPLALVVVLGLIILPSVYAWYSVEAMWNPYSHTNGLKVAVVNNDAGAKLSEMGDLELSEDFEGSDEIDVGSMMVEAMKRDESLDWQFVDAAQGQAGLESGEYYAEFILPESFSKDFLSVLSGRLTNPTIEYWVNEKYNAVALEVTDAGAGVVDALVNRVFSDIAADTISGVVKDIASDVVSAGGSVESKAQSSLSGAVRDLQSVGEGLQRAEGSIDQWRSTVSSSESSLDALKSTVPSLRDSLASGKDLLSDARAAAHAVDSAYSSALAQGGPELEAALDEVSKKVKDAASAIGDKQSDLNSSLQKAKKTLQDLDSIITTLLDDNPGSSALRRLKEQNEKLQQQISDLEKANKAIAQAARDASNASDSFTKDIDEAIGSMEDRNDDFNRVILPQLDSALDSLALTIGSLDGALGSLDAQITQAKSLLEELDDVLSQSKSTLETTSASLDEMGGNLESARSDLSSIAGSEAAKKIAEVAKIDVKSYGTFMSSPVTAELNPVYPVNSYGAGVAPFYTCLAIWVGCFMLIAVLKLEADPRHFPGMTAWQGYSGRLVLFVLLSLLQGAVVTVGDMVLGVEAASAAAFVLAGLAVAFCFINIVYALAITFKHVGKALAVIFLIVQIPGASGMYPIELMPSFFQALYPWLPFTYGMDAMREAVGGFYGSTYIECSVWLVVCGVIAFALALFVRPAVLNLNRLFDRKLEAADLFITEENGLGTDVRDDRPVMGALLEDERSRQGVMERARRLEGRYEVVQQVAPVAVIALTVSLGLVSMLLNPSIDMKLLSLVAFIAAVVAVFCIGVAFEYAYENVKAQISRWERGVTASPRPVRRAGVAPAPVAVAYGGSFELDVEGEPAQRPAGQPAEQPVEQPAGRPVGQPHDAAAPEGDVFDRYSPYSFDDFEPEEPDASRMPTGEIAGLPLEPAIEPLAFVEQHFTLSAEGAFAPAQSEEAVPAAADVQSSPTEPSLQQASAPNMPNLFLGPSRDDAHE